MNGESNDRDGKRTIVVVTIIILIFDLALGAIALIVGPIELFGGDRREIAAGDEEPREEEARPMDEAGTDAEPEPEDVAEPETASQTGRISAPESYRVRPGDTLYDVSRRLWGDEDYWPLIYLRNVGRLDHPDQISPYRDLSLGTAPLEDGTLDDEEREELLRGYVAAYQAYRRHGEEALDIGLNNSNEYIIQRGRVLINKAQWLLYRGLVIDPGYLDDYETDIQERDRPVVEDYRQRFGLPIDSRD
jgi:hypothetical protein